MKTSLRTITLLLVVLLLPTLPIAAEGMTLTDMTGRQVVLSAPAQRIVALTAADVEILYAIGAGEKLVGRGEYCNYPLEVLQVPAVQSGNETNVEQIIALQPDLVIMAKMGQQVEQVVQLEAAGISVVGTDAMDITGTYEAIRLLGTLTGQGAQAEDVVANMAQGFDALGAQALKAGVSGSVYFEVSPLQWGLWTAGSETFMDELASLLGLENAFADVEGWKEISQEQVLSRDPDYIVTVGMYFGEGPTPVEEIMSRAGWQTLGAVAGSRVWNADPDAIGRPGPRLLDAAGQLLAFVLAPMQGGQPQ